jgi:hypothetical protein
MKENTSHKENVNLLWTGGWDSTFQLLRLLLINKNQVTPYYLIDEERPSTFMEIRALKRIKDRLLKEYPHIRELLNPTNFFAVADISPDSEITQAYHAIHKETYMAPQNEFLARFCKQIGITDMQICFEARIQPTKERFDTGRLVSDTSDGSQSEIRIDPKYKTTKANLILQYFTFPTINLTKNQMADIGKKNGWNEILEMTWFCHQPTKNKLPCGRCIPCSIAIGEGFGWRIPIKSRIVSFMYKTLFWPLKSLAKNILSKLGLLSYFQRSG